MPDVARQFLDDSRSFLTQSYLPEIERVAGQLTDEQIWARASDASNSIGNLLLHLAGSSRHWAVEVIGGTSIGRNRDEEFARREVIPSANLLADLRAAVGDVDRVLAGLRESDILEVRARGDEEYTVLWCVYHIVEHFGMHTGQILSMAKAMVGDLTQPVR